jgi:hypothetical protein
MWFARFPRPGELGLEKQVPFLCLIGNLSHGSWSMFMTSFESDVSRNMEPLSKAPTRLFGMSMVLFYCPDSPPHTVKRRSHVTSSYVYPIRDECSFVWARGSVLRGGLLGIRSRLIPSLCDHACLPMAKSAQQH